MSKTRVACSVTHSISLRDTRNTTVSLLVWVRCVLPPPLPVAQLVRRDRPPSHWPFMPAIAISASCHHHHYTHHFRSARFSDKQQQRVPRCTDLLHKIHTHESLIRACNAHNLTVPRTTSNHVFLLFTFCSYTKQRTSLQTTLYTKLMQTWQLPTATSHFQLPGNCT